MGSANAATLGQLTIEKGSETPSCLPRVTGVQPSRAKRLQCATLVSQSQDSRQGKANRDGSLCVCVCVSDREGSVLGVPSQGSGPDSTQLHSPPAMEHIFGCLHSSRSLGSLNWKFTGRRSRANRSLRALAHKPGEDRLVVRLSGPEGPPLLHAA